MKTVNFNKKIVFGYFRESSVVSVNFVLNTVNAKIKEYKTTVIQKREKNEIYTDPLVVSGRNRRMVYYCVRA